MLHLQSVRTVMVVAAFGALAIGARQAPVGEWRYFGGDKAFTRYSLLDQINRDNVSRLRIVWRQPAVDPELLKVYPDLKVTGNFRSTPIMVDGVLYAPNGIGLVRALDAGSGTTLWEQEPFAPTLEEVAGQSPRGVDHWRDGRDERLLAVRGEYLYALNAKTGKLYRDFGTRGRVSLHWDHPLSKLYSWTAGPLVVGDVVVVAGNTDGAGDTGTGKEAAPENVRGYDVRTGKLLWTFNVVPQAGEFGNETWGDESWRTAGDLGSWCCLTADEELGYVYVPLTAPTVTYYGGWRPGSNLFSNSLVALDVKTGKRVWHFQMVHHDLWEYDTVGPATLGEIRVDGRRIRTVMQPSKTGFLYVFDRATGRPVWPIEERSVAPSMVPGEHASPTQPFPTKPPPFDRQGFTEDDLIDFTPELRAKARELVAPFVLGPLFTPPSVKSEDPDGKKGTLTTPGPYGSGNWNTGAFDPETGIYYAVSHTIPAVYDLVRPLDPKATLKYTIEWQQRGPTPSRHTNLTGPEGLPIVKPPYGRITAIDLNRGEQVWMVANGDGPRNHPLLTHLNLPPLGTPGRAAPLVTKSLLFVSEGSDFSVRDGYLGKKIRAFDKATGTVVWEFDLPAGATGAPVTYLFQGKQYIVLAIGGRESPPEWIAFALP